MDPHLLRPLEKLKLSVRSLRVLNTAKIYRIGDLIEYTETDLSRIPYLGPTSLNEIKEVLAAQGLALPEYMTRSQSE